LFHLSSVTQGIAQTAIRLRGIISVGRRRFHAVARSMIKD
jgi:hypothetical protein